MGYVQTVLGPVDPSEITRVMQHEHLLRYLPGPFPTGGAGDVRDQNIAMSVTALGELPRLGFNTIVELSSYKGETRDAAGLADVSQLSGMHIVMGVAIYLETMSPQWARDASLDEMTERFEKDATVGVDGTDIKAGVFGEQATGLGSISPHEEKCLRAAARAAKATGRTLNTHTTHSTMALEQVEILVKEEGLDPERIIIGHMDITDDVEYVRTVLRTGVTVAFDTIGKQFWDFVLAPLPVTAPPGEFAKRAYYRPDSGRLENLVTLVREGWTEKIVLSEDLTARESYLNERTHGTLGLSYLGQVFVPMMEAAGISEEQVDQMLVSNPVRHLTID
jgi:phosphotriesterase-related protein